MPYGSRRIQTKTVRLITRRSQVQILSPPPKKALVRTTIRPGLLSFSEPVLPDLSSICHRDSWQNFPGPEFLSSNRVGIGSEVASTVPMCRRRLFVWCLWASSGSDSQRSSYQGLRMTFGSGQIAGRPVEARRLSATQIVSSVITGASARA